MRALLEQWAQLIPDTWLCGVALVCIAIIYFCLNWEDYWMDRHHWGRDSQDYWERLLLEEPGFGDYP